MPLGWVHPNPAIQGNRLTTFEAYERMGDWPRAAEAYARAAFETLGAHAMTVNAYLGTDSLALEETLHRILMDALRLCPAPRQRSRR